MTIGKALSWRALPVLVLFVVVSACSSATSPDDASALPDSTLASTDATGSTVGVVAQDWTRVAHDESVFGGPDDQEMSGLVVGGPGFVAVGYDASGGDWDAAVWTSPDGVVWSRVPHDESVFGGPDDQTIADVVAGGPGFVAVGRDYSGGDGDAAVWTSPDGVLWSRVPHDASVFGGRPDFQEMWGVVAGGPGLVAVGGYDASGGDWDAAVWTSPDGVLWSRVPPHDASVFGGPDDQEMFGVAAGGPGLVAVGRDWSGGDWDAAVWTSPDGVLWSRAPHDESVFGGPDGQGMVGVVAGGPGFVAVGWDYSGGDLDAAVWVTLPPD